MLLQEVVPLDVKIFARNLGLNSEAEGYIQKKFKRLERHLKTISDAKLEMSRTSARSQSDRVAAQLTLTAHGRTLRGEGSGLTLFAAVDAVTDVMDRQIQRYKGKFYRSSQAKRAARAGSAREDDPAAPAEAEGEPEGDLLPDLGSVVRRKRFPMTPMNVENAITEMELLSHDFFFFYNKDTDEYNLVYRRHDGDYGVIEPELA